MRSPATATRRSYRPRPAYRFTVENSVYVEDGLHRQGIGQALLAALIDRCAEGPWRQMIAVIGDSENAASIGLHARLGFRQVGTLTAVGFKFGRWVDFRADAAGDWRMSELVIFSPSPLAGEGQGGETLVRPTAQPHIR